MPAQLGERRQCEKCGKEIIFLKHEKSGKLAPIEVEPQPEGRFEVDWDSNSYRTIAGKSKDGSLFSQRRHGESYYENHYVTCPEAQFFRDRTATRGRERG